MPPFALQDGNPELHSEYISDRFWICFEYNSKYDLNMFWIGYGCNRIALGAHANNMLQATPKDRQDSDMCAAVGSRGPA